MTMTMVKIADLDVYLDPFRIEAIIAAVDHTVVVMRSGEVVHIHGATPDDVLDAMERAAAA